MRNGLIHGGIINSDWFSDRELMALAISIVTKMDRAIVIGSGDCKKRTHYIQSLENVLLRKYQTCLEQVAADAFEVLWLCGALKEVAKLVVVDLGPGGVVQEPVGRSAHGGDADVHSNGHVPVHNHQSLFQYHCCWPA